MLFHEAVMFKISWLAGLGATLLLAGCCVTEPREKPVAELLVVGDGITCHAPLPELGWNGDWGMAATSAERDFAHRLLAHIRKKSPDAALRVDGIMYEDTMTGWVHLLPNHADVIVIQLGENYHGGVSADEYCESYARMIDELSEGSSPVVVCVGTWNRPDVDTIIRRAAESRNAPFVDLSPIAADPANHAAADGVYPKLNSRPGDRGMQAIADAVADAVDSRLTVH